MIMKAKTWSGKRRKAQFSQILGFIVLAVMVTFFIIFIRLSTVPSSLGTLTAIREVHENKDIRAGANVLFFSTEQKTGKPIMELVGLAAYIANETIDFGPVIGQINVRKEIEKRMNAMFGEGKWYVKIPIPERPADIQIVVVADVSGSMCDDVRDLARSVPKILNELKEAGRKAEITVYLLPGPGSCCLEGTPMTISCADIGFQERKDFICVTIQIADCELKGESNLENSEDWGDGIACAAQHGPQGGWKEHTIRIGIPLSDELSMGSEICCQGGDCSRKHKSVERAIKAAVENEMKVFPLRAYACGNFYYPVNGRCDNPKVYNPGDAGGQFHYICSCSSTKVVEWMEEIANKTGGKMYDLAEAPNTAESIKEIIIEQKAETIPYIEAGTWPSPSGKRVWSWDFEIPVSMAGIYTVAHVYKWN
jgi:hypothetical protein